MNMTRILYNYEYDNKTLPLWTCRSGRRARGGREAKRPYLIVMI